MTFHIFLGVVQASDLSRGIPVIYPRQKLVSWVRDDRWEFSSVYGDRSFPLHLLSILWDDCFDLSQWARVYFSALIASFTSSIFSCGLLAPESWKPSWSTPERECRKGKTCNCTWLLPTTHSKMPQVISIDSNSTYQWRYDITTPCAKQEDQRSLTIPIISSYFTPYSPKVRLSLRLLSTDRSMGSHTFFPLTSWAPINKKTEYWIARRSEKTLFR